MSKEEDEYIYVTGIDIEYEGTWNEVYHKTEEGAKKRYESLCEERGSFSYNTPFMYIVKLED